MRLVYPSTTTRLKLLLKPCGLPDNRPGGRKNCGKGQGERSGLAHGRPSARWRAGVERLPMRLGLRCGGPVWVWPPHRTTDPGVTLQAARKVIPASARRHRFLDPAVHGSPQVEGAAVLTQQSMLANFPARGRR